MVHKNKAEKDVNNYEKKEAKKAHKESAEFANEAKKDENKTIK